MTNLAKAKGSAFEREVVAYLQAHGFPQAQRLYGAGRQDDRGDVTIGGREAGLIVIEAKNHATLKFPEWLAEAEAERLNAGATYGVVVAKRRGKSAKSAYVVQTLAQFATMLQQLTNER